MTLDEFDKFVEDNPRVSWALVRAADDGKHDQVVDIADADGIAFRVRGYPWYDDHPENYTYVPLTVLAEITAEKLLDELTRGLAVEHITRITGYYTRKSSWNKGKLAELRDRYRNPGFEAATKD